MFSTLVYNIAAAAAGATNSDLTAATDDEFSTRNSHYIFTERYRLLAAYAGGASLLRGRFQVPTWNAVGEFTIPNVNRSLDPPSNPRWNTYLPYAPEIPMNEEFQVQLTNNLGMGTENENVVLQVAPEGWNANIPRGRLPINIRATASPTMLLDSWSAVGALTLSQSLRGGVYSVIGTEAVVDDAVAFRIIFPRSRLYNGRKLRPGSVCTNTAGNVNGYDLSIGRQVFGEWGRFHTFELPQIQFFGTVAGAETAQVFLDLVYLGEEVSLLQGGMGAGY